MATPRVALAITVREESRLLRANLEYHHHLGVDRAFVYLDEEGDRTSRTVVDLPFVEINRCVPPAQFASRPGLERFIEGWQTHLSARQSLNVVDAMARASGEGCEWLLSIDADELVCLDRQRSGAGDLSERLAKLAPEIDVAWLPNLEVVQGLGESDLVFGEASRFKRSDAPLRREIRDPRNGACVSRTGFLGHRSGKSAVRLRRPARPESSHHFVTPSGAALPEATIGELLHYYAYDFDDWVRRCRNYRGHAGTHLSGVPVEPHKLLWIELVNDAGLDLERLGRFYEETIAFDGAALRRLSRWRWTHPFRKPPLVEVLAVVRFFADPRRAPRARSPAPPA